MIFCFQAAITLQNLKLSQPTQTNAPKSTKSRQNEVSKKFDVKFQKQATILLVHEDHGEVTKFFGSMFKFPLSNLSPKVKFPLANSFIEKEFSHFSSKNASKLRIYSFSVPIKTWKLQAQTCFEKKGQILPPNNMTSKPRNFFRLW